MTHQSELERSLDIERLACAEGSRLPASLAKSNDAWLFITHSARDGVSRSVGSVDLCDVAGQLGPDAILAVLTTPRDAAELVPKLSAVASFQLWIAVKLENLATTGLGVLAEQHAALLVFSKYRRSLRHTKTRIAYTFCPACDKTTKDYGGKKHTYHHYGTLISDVWRDIAWNPSGSLELIGQRLADLFAVEPHKKLWVCDWRDELSAPKPTSAALSPSDPSASIISPASTLLSQLVLGDCLEKLRSLPNDSIDFCFADPPYNIDKKYDSWDDSLDLQKYFQWCDAWLDELARVLRPGCTCAVLNIPQFAVRHFTHLSQRLRFQNWIAWEGLSLPVRMIMPAHYSIVCFSKGTPRPLPGLVNEPRAELEQEAVSTLREFYCVRQSCVASRRHSAASDRQPLSDLWWDIHRLKHNSRRVDHPCQLPPALMHRLIAVFTRPGELVLDPFDGAGTTSLCAAQLGRRFLGMEMSERYHQIAQERHELLARGGDPFAKAKSVPKAKNSRVKRIGGLEYAVPKKALQLEVREIARRLGRLPTREEVEQQSQYPIRYFDEYFISWGEVCAAARTTGMKETRERVEPMVETADQTAFAFMQQS